MPRATPTMLAAVAVAGAAFAQSAPSPDLGSLAWLAGCWHLEKGEMRVDEWWMPPAGGLMLGMARTLRGGVAVEHEHLLLRAEEGGIVLTASPSGQATASFRLVTLGAGEAVFANLAHDFPQRISYRRLADGGLAARVEGVVDGSLEGVDFPYRPGRCVPENESERPDGH